MEKTENEYINKIYILAFSVVFFIPFLTLELNALRYKTISALFKLVYNDRNLIDTFTARLYSISNKAKGLRTLYSPLLPLDIAF